MDKKCDKAAMLHDIANAISPLLNHPSRIKNLAENMEAGLGYLEQIHYELNQHSERIGEYLLEDPEGKKMLPMLGELCKMERQNLDRFHEEHDRLSKLLKKMSHIVTDHQLKLLKETPDEDIKPSKSES